MRRSAAVAIVAAFGFVVISIATAADAFVPIDAGARAVVVERGSWLLAAIAVAVSSGVAAGAAVAVTAAAAAACVGRPASGLLVRLSAATSLAAGAGLLVKVAAGRVRPTPRLWEAPLASGAFPSVHVSVAAAAGLVFWLALQRRAVRWRRSSGVAITALVLLVGASRVYLDVHWVSDVLAGLALGVACGAVAWWRVPEQWGTRCRPERRRQDGSPPSAGTVSAVGPERPSRRSRYARVWSRQRVPPADSAPHSRRLEEPNGPSCPPSARSRLKACAHGRELPMSG